MNQHQQNIENIIQIASDAFDAGKNYGFELATTGEPAFPPTSPDKEAYISSLRTKLLGTVLIVGHISAGKHANLLYELSKTMPDVTIVTAGAGGTLNKMDGTDGIDGYFKPIPTPFLIQDTLYIAAPATTESILEHPKPNFINGGKGKYKTRNNRGR